MGSRKFIPAKFLKGTNCESIYSRKLILALADREILFPREFILAKVLVYTNKVQRIVHAVHKRTYQKIDNFSSNLTLNFAEIKKLVKNFLKLLWNWRANPKLKKYVYARISFLRRCPYFSILMHSALGSEADWGFLLLMVRFLKMLWFWDEEKKTPKNCLVDWPKWLILETGQNLWGKAARRLFSWDISFSKPGLVRYPENFDRSLKFRNFS